MRRFLIRLWIRLATLFTRRKNDDDDFATYFPAGGLSGEHQSVFGNPRASAYRIHVPGVPKIEIQPPTPAVVFDSPSRVAQLVVGRRFSFLARLAMVAARETVSPTRRFSMFAAVSPVVHSFKPFCMLDFLCATHN